MTGEPAGRSGQGTAEALVAARACYGWLLACAPRQMIRAGTPQPPGRRAVLATRVLGGRHLVQALLTATGEAASLPPAAVFALGAAVDALHAASMAGLAAMYRPLRRVALADTALESGFAAVGAVTAWRSLARQPARQAAATSPRRTPGPGSHRTSAGRPACGC